MQVAQTKKSKACSTNLQSKSDILEAIADPSPDYTCEFCSKTFLREKSFLVHMCEKKQRWLDRDQKYFTLAYLAYNRFYEIAYKASKKKTTTDFIESKYYNDFIKFGRYLNNINALEPEGFIESLIRNQVKLREWTKDHYYNDWVRSLTRKESWEKAFERNLLLIYQWSQEVGEEPNKFFALVNTNLAVQWIQTGRLSPWILYTAPSAQLLFERMAEDQLRMIQGWLDPKYWKSVFARNVGDYEAIEQALIEEGF